MASYQITMRDRRVEYVDGADAYRREGSMTTFFAHADGRPAGTWSSRVATFPTDEILVVRRQEPAPGAEPLPEPA